MATQVWAMLVFEDLAPSRVEFSIRMNDTLTWNTGNPNNSHEREYRGNFYRQFWSGALSLQQARRLTNCRTCDN